MSRPSPRINPSGRPTERAGFEAAVSIGIILGWSVVTIAILVGTMLFGVHDGPLPSVLMVALSALCWVGAVLVAGRERHLVWPASAFGIVGPVGLGFALSMATPELRGGPPQDRVTVVVIVSALAMIPFLFRFRLPGLVSPIITFLLVGLFLVIYGTDMDRLREVEGFSARGILAALLNQPGFAVAFTALAAAALAAARHLDLKSDNFGLAAARPLHLVGAGVLALVAGRLLILLPGPLDAIGLALAWVGATVWTLRVNRVAVVFAAHLAMVKPAVLAFTGMASTDFDLRQWTLIVCAILVVDLVSWPLLHRQSQRLRWTLGPGGRLPPDRPGILWRYWPYA